jgi:RES domain-containing protein
VIFDRETVEALEHISPSNWKGIVYRHMFANFPPERENTRGARWNPTETPAIYASLDRDVAIAEADYYISLQPVPPRARRVVYRIEVALGSVLDLSDPATLAQVGLSIGLLATIDHSKCQEIGGAAEWLEHDGLLVPSARAPGVNLVIFPNRKKPSYRFDVLDSEELPASS